jgi:hypothetical protein
VGAVKMSISLDAERAKKLRREAKQRKTTVSAIIAEALAVEERQKARRLLIDTLGGPVNLTPEEMEEIRREWAGAPSTPAR